MELVDGFNKPYSHGLRSHRHAMGESPLFCKPNPSQQIAVSNSCSSEHDIAFNDFLKTENPFIINS